MAPSTLSVGGAGGIVITSIVHAGTSPLTYGPVRGDEPLAWLRGHEQVVGRCAIALAAIVFAAASSLVAVLALPWMLMLAPTVAMGALAVGGVVFARRRPAEGAAPAVEHRILQLAMQCGGRLTITSVAASLSLTLAESDRALTELARGGHVEIGNDPTTGVVVYTFPDIQAGLVPTRRTP